MKPLTELVQHAKWFHSIAFDDGLVSPGRFSATTPPNYTLFGVFELLNRLDFKGATVIDVGTMDGLVAFTLERLGAGRVIATDLAKRETFEAANAALSSKVEYRVPLQVVDLPKVLGADKADLIVMAGVLYHVFDPLQVLVACREALRRGGFLIVETSYLFDEGRPYMSFNPVDESGRGIERANVFWRPSQSALEGMLEMVGFQLKASVAVDGRLAVLAQAQRPSDVQPKTKRLADIHTRYMKYANYRESVDFDKLEQDSTPASRVTFKGPTGHSRIYPGIYKPTSPLQPKWEPTLHVRVRHVARSISFHARATMANAKAKLGRAWASS
jgi:SAM-dependent methyltransferase